MHYTTNAYNVRIDRARNTAEFALRRSSIVASLTNEIANFHNGQLRERGGFTAMIKTAIGNAPDSMNNDLGMPTNPDYWIWQALNHETEKMRSEIQRTLANR